MKRPRSEAIYSKWNGPPNRAQQLAKGLVFGMIQIGVAIFFIFEAQDESVRKSLVVLFRADIGSPFVGLYFFDLFLQVSERGFDFPDLLLGGIRFKFEG